MFIGHFGTAFAAKAASPSLSLGTAFLAAQFIDLLWPTLLLLGVEHVRIAPGATTVTPLVFEHYPWSHSLIAVIAWGVLLGALYRVVRRDTAGAILVGALVVSHWVLDLLVHAPDLPLMPGSDLTLGLGLWSSLPGTLFVELGIFAAGTWYYLRRTDAVDLKGRWGLWGLIAALVAIYLGNLFGTPPPSVQAIAWVGQLQWLLVAWAFWVDAHRRSRG